MSIVYIQKEMVDHINLTNDTGADLVQYEFTVIGGLSLVADEAIADGVEGSFHVEDGLILQIEDFVSGEDTFGTENADVFWEPVSGDFSDTSTAGYYKVGIVKEVKNANNIVLITKNREAGSGSGAVSALPITIVQKIIADASAGIAVPALKEGDEIVAVHIICTASNANGTLILETGADDDITDGMICAVDTTVVYAGTIDDANSTLPATGAQILSVGGTAADTRGIVVIDYIPA